MVRAFAYVLFVIVLTPAAHAERAIFSVLPIPAGADDVFARAVSADGRIVVGQGETAGTDYAIPFRWAASTGLSTLSSPGGFLIPANVINCSGDGSQIVGTGLTGAGLKTRFAACRWNGDQRPHSLDPEFPIDPTLGGLPSTWAYGASFNGGVIVGGYGETSADPYYSASRAFYWETGTVTLLPDLLGGLSFFENSVASAASADGQVVVGMADGFNPGEPFQYPQAARWRRTPDGWSVEGLGDLGLGGFNSIATGVTPDGAVIIGVSDAPSGRLPFRWTEAEGMVAIGTPLEEDYASATVKAVSQDGRLIVGAWSWGLLGTPEQAGHAFVWRSASGLQDLKTMLQSEYGLDLSGWTLRLASGVSASGRTIVGSGVDASGRSRGWIVRFPASDLRGDLDCDGRVTFDDIDSFVLALAAPLGYLDAYPECDAGLADLDQDGTVDFDDIDGFVACLITGGC